MAKWFDSWWNVPLYARATFFFAAILFSIPSISSAQELTTTADLSNESLQVSLQPMTVGCHKIKQIEVGAVFCFALTVKSSNVAWLKDLKVRRFDMVMPEHRHGIVTRARVQAIKPGEYLIDGVKAHMPGEWKITIDLVHAKSATQVAIPLKL